MRCGGTTMQNTPVVTGTNAGDFDLRDLLLKVSEKLVRMGLNRGTSGNCSVRCVDNFLITPSGIPVETMSTQDMVEMDFAGRVTGTGTPSSEWRFHRDILAARAEVNAIVHVHSVFATTLACLRRSIPAFHYMVSVAGGDCIRCAPYALFGSQALSDLALDALDERKACLLANHGMIALGRDLQNALDIALEVETLSEQYCQALKIGEPHILSTEQMQHVLEQFRHYGSWNQQQT